jgi:hypothetical protein
MFGNRWSDAPALVEKSFNGIEVLLAGLLIWDDGPRRLGGIGRSPCDIPTGNRRRDEANNSRVFFGRCSLIFISETGRDPGTRCAA